MNLLSLLLRRSPVTCPSVSSLSRSRKTKNLRGNLTSKRGNRLFHKGYGTPKLGTINTMGRFTFSPNLDALLETHIPDLRGFALKPYVSK
jgi:hypothetical protein